MRSARRTAAVAAVAATAATAEIAAIAAIAATAEIAATAATAEIAAIAAVDGIAPIAAVAAMAAATVSCGPAGKPAKVGASDVAVKSVAAPVGVTLVAACTPTGPELCFNAVDDNCNGVVDEGCGLGTGVLQFVVAWGDSPADVDLVVTDPSGTRVFDGNKSTPSGLHLDRDCPARDCYGQNVENVFFEGTDPPRGRYLVEVKLADLKGAPSPVHVRFGARVGFRSYGADLLLSQSDDRKGFTFEL